LSESTVPWVYSPHFLFKSTHHNTKHSKTKLPWFSGLLRYSASWGDGLILQCCRAHTVFLLWHKCVSDIECSVCVVFSWSPMFSPL